MDRVIIFDTTLRDGEQAPGFSMNTMEKLEMARQLARLNVDVIEAGFPISSEEDFAATREVARQVGTLENAPSICGLSRVGLGDIDRCWEAVRYARRPRIHTFVATSDIHLKYKLRKSRAEILKASVEAVRHARGYCEDVEFSPEEIVMALRTRRDFFGIDTRVRTEEIFRSSRLLSHITGVHVQPNKAIVGENAFAHEAGIHQDGVLKEKLTYEIMRPEDIGRASNKLVLGKHSGRHALAARLKDLGIELAGPELDGAFKKFNDLADREKEAYHEDLLAIVTDEATKIPETYELDYLHVISGTGVEVVELVGLGDLRR